MLASSQRTPPQRSYWDWATFAVLLATCVLLFASLPYAGTPGWDESGHGFAALRLAEPLRAFDLARFGHQLVADDFYPPIGRFGALLGILCGGDSFAAPRVVSIAAWVGAIGCGALIARRLADAPSAGFFAALLGSSCWLGNQHARTGFQEPWCALLLALLALAALAVQRRPTSGRVLLLGAAIALCVLCKYTYGILGAGAVLGAFACEVLARRWSALRFCLLLSGMALVFAWWFVLPLPAGTAMGALHRSSFWLYVTKAAELDGLYRSDLWIVWGLQMCVTPLALILQCGGCLLAALHAREFGPRLLFFFALAGTLAFLCYPYRIERFLLPTSFALFALGGWAAAWLVQRAPARLRAWAAPALLIVALATIGFGSRRLFFALRGDGLDEDGRARALATIRSWRKPIAFSGAPSCGPPGLAGVLDFAARELRPDKPFVWIGGSCTELPIALLRWRLQQASRARELPQWDLAERDHLWTDNGFDSASFRAWALQFEQVGTLDPPDPRDRPGPGRAFEARFVAWMSADPDFTAAAAIEVELSPGHVHRVTIYSRRER